MCSSDLDVNETHFGQNNLLTTLWKIIYKGLYENVV